MSFRVTKGVASQGSKTTLNSPAESRASKTSKKQARSRQNSSDAAGSETGRIKVGIRCRPANENETKAGLTKQAWSMSRTEIEQVLDADAALLKTRKQTYDYIFDENSSTRDVYDMQCAPIVQRSLEGYNGTIFAYGQTGSGKTHTLMGDLDSNPGIVYLALEDLYNYVDRHPTTEVQMEVSFLEIYNEQIMDLLDISNTEKLQIVDNPILGPMVKGMTTVKVFSAAHAASVLATGEKNRHVRATDMNAKSSRSHTVFQCRVSSSSIQDSAGGNDNSLDEISGNMKTVADLLMTTQGLIHADRYSLYLVDEEHRELYIQNGTLMLRLPLGSGIAGSVGQSGDTINITEAYQDERFNKSIDRKTGYRTKAILCCPLKSASGDIVGVVQFINKTNDEKYFTREDESHANAFALKSGPLVSEASKLSRVSKTALLNIVDLAGSERASTAGTTGAALKEGANINTSLLNLGTCISMLSKQTRGYVPYRNSKLTRILSTSLGGNALTSIICAISPTTKDCNQSKSTLHFATRAMSVVNKAKRNHHRDPSDLLHLYEKEISSLRRRLSSSEVPEAQKAKVDILHEQVQTSTIEKEAIIKDFVDLFYTFEPTFPRRTDHNGVADFYEKMQHLKQIALGLNALPNVEETVGGNIIKMKALDGIVERLRVMEENTVHLEEVKETNEIMKEAQDALTAYNEELLLKLEKVEEEIKDHVYLQGELKLNIEALKKENALVVGKFDNITIKLSELENDTAVLRALVESSEKKEIGMHGKLSDLEREKLGMQSRVLQLEKNKTEMNDKMLALETENAVLKETNRGYQKKIEDVESSRDSLLLKLDVVKTEYGDILQAKEHNDSRVMSLHREAQQPLIDELAALREENASLMKNQLSLKESMLISSRREIASPGMSHNSSITLVSPNRANTVGNIQTDLDSCHARSGALENELVFAKEALEQYTVFFNDWKRRLSTIAPVVVGAQTVLANGEERAPGSNCD